MKRSRKIYLITTTAILALAWGYAVVRTLWNVDEAIGKMAGQLFPRKWAGRLTALNTLLQLFTSIVLIRSFFYHRLQVWGFSLTILLLGVYMVYIRAVLEKTYSKIPPCACITWSEKMTWSQAQRCNVGLLLLTTGALLWLNPKERRTSSRR